MSHDPNWLNQIMQVVAKDPRFKPDSYGFLLEALEFTRSRLSRQRGSKVKHVSGPELLGGLRQLALQQFGLLAKIVLNQWGITRTSDIGEMVFNLVESGDVEKTEQDCLADFDNVFDFDTAFSESYRIGIDELDA